MTTIEELTQQLESSKTTDRLDVLLKMAGLLRSSNLPKMFEVAQEAIQLATTLRDKSRLAEANGYLGIYYWQSGQFEEALLAYDKSFEVYQKIGDIEGCSRTYSRIGVIYDNLSDYARAMEYYRLALEAQNVLNAHQEASILINLGTLHFKTEDYENALEAYQQAIEPAEEEGNENQLILLYTNLGIAYSHTGNYQGAAHYLQKAVNFAEESNNQLGLASALVNYGDFLLKQENYQQSLEIQRRARDICIDIGAMNLLPYAYTNIGSAQIRLEEYDSAKTNLEKALEMSYESGDKRLTFEVYRLLAELYEAFGSFERALNYFKQFHALRDEVLAEKNAQQTDALKARYENELQKNQGEIYRLQYIELVKAHEELELSNEERNQFMKMVAHELQNPLSSIKMNASLLQNYIEQLSPEKINERIEKIVNTSETMTQIVEKILELSLLKEGKAEMTITPMDLGAMAQQMVEIYHDRAQLKSIIVHFAPPHRPLTALADETALQQVMDNLISNAVKYTPQGKNVFVSIESDEDYVRFIVRDEGLGLSDEDKEQLFREFITLSARPTGGERSTGLGLAIVKMMVEAMGGTVWAESAGKNEGSVFTVELPLGE